jgi:hypothetical protein
MSTVGYFRAYNVLEKYVLTAQGFNSQDATEQKRRQVFKYSKGKGRVKAIPLQALTSPEVSNSLRLPDFKTIGT